AEAQQQVHSAVASLNVLDPSSELGRFEEQVRRQESQVLGQQELQASSLDAQFAELEASAESLEVEARFEALRSGSLEAGPGQPEGQIGQGKHSADPNATPQ